MMARVTMKKVLHDNASLTYSIMETMRERDALQAELESLRQQLATSEPVAWMVTVPYEKQVFNDESSAIAYMSGLNRGFGQHAYVITPLFTSPPKQAIPEGWISVNDKLPEDAVYVIAANIVNGELWNWNKARYSSTAKRWFIGNNYAFDHSHWMPIPPAPTNTEVGE